MFCLDIGFMRSLAGYSPLLTTEIRRRKICLSGLRRMTPNAGNDVAEWQGTGQEQVNVHRIKQ
jgi:hypothetical protein